MTLIKMIFFVLFIIVGSLFFTLYINQANLFDEPGFGKRLTLFLTTNTAVTADNHPLRELRTPYFQMDADELYEKVILAISELGWLVSSHSSEDHSIQATVHTRVFLFEDEIMIKINSLGKDLSTLQISSSSRVGGVDFAANSGHIQSLIAKLRDWK